MVRSNETSSKINRQYAFHIPRKAQPRMLSFWMNQNFCRGKIGMKRAWRRSDISPDGELLGTQKRKCSGLSIISVEAHRQQKDSYILGSIFFFAKSCSEVYPNFVFFFYKLSSFKRPRTFSYCLTPSTVLLSLHLCSVCLWIHPEQYDLALQLFDLYFLKLVWWK